MFGDLIAKIDAALTNQRIVVVGISGFAGSGKTRLSETLCKHYGISDGQVVHLDNIYTPMPRGKGLFDDYDWTLLKSIIEQAKTGNNLDYQGVDFEGNPYPWRFHEKLPRVLVVEGIRLFRPELMPCFDISVWVNCPPELALERAKARDLSQGHDAAYMKRWDNEWAPQNQLYFETYHPEKLSNFLYEEYR